TSLPAFASSTSTTRAVASTWPWTRWPSSVADALSGSSRLTSVPGLSAPRLVRRSVSGTTSAKKTGPRFLTTVRQQPLTATLLPIFRRPAIAAWSIPTRPRSASTTLATALTIPVNIDVSADEEIIAETRHVEVPKGHRISQVLDSLAAEWAGRVAATDELRRDVGVDLVDQARRE